MKKLTILFSALFLLTAGNLFAQESTELNVTASVIGTGLVIQETAPLAFGTVVVDTAPEIETTDPNVGVLSVSGEANQAVFISFPALITLTNGGGPELVVATNAAVGLNPETSDILTDEDEFDLDGDGNQNIYVGGTLQSVDGGNIPANATGEYTGSGTITVQYNSF